MLDFLPNTKLKQQLKNTDYKPPVDDNSIHVKDNPTLVKDIATSVKDNPTPVDIRGSDTKKIEKTINKKQRILKIFTSTVVHPYTKSGYENIKAYNYGIYINLPQDTTGVADEIMNLLIEKAVIAQDNDVVTLWVFSNSMAIPKSFESNWSTPKSTKKCFAQAIRLNNGNYMYNYDMFMNFRR